MFIHNNSSLTYEVAHIKQVQVQPFINGRPFKNDRAFTSTRKALPASVYKYPGVYKRSANMTGSLYILFHNIRYFLLIIPDFL